MHTALAPAAVPHYKRLSTIAWAYAYFRYTERIRAIRYEQATRDVELLTALMNEPDEQLRRRLLNDYMQQ